MVYTVVVASTPYKAVVSTELEAVHCLEYVPLVFQVMLEMFNHSGRVVEAAYVQLSAGETEKLASMVLDVAVV